MAGDLPATVLLWDARFPAQKGDKCLIDVAVPDTLASIGKEKLHWLTGLRVDLSELLLWPDMLPLVDALADKGMHRLGVGGRGFVHWDIQKKPRIFWSGFSGLWNHHIFLLPA